MYDKSLGDQLLKFLVDKPADETYHYSMPNICAAAQFNDSVGRQYPMTEAISDRHEMTTFDGMLEGCANMQPRTFGALLSRVRPRLLEDA